MPESSPYSNASNGGLNAFPVAANFSDNPALGDQVGLFDGTNWYLDTTGSGVLSTKVPSLITGYPIVGDFNGDGLVDLGTYRDGTFYFQMGTGPGTFSTTVLSYSLVGSGLPQLGANTRPVAADMDMDGITDVGLYVPDGSGATGTSTSDWYWFVTGGAAPTPGAVTALYDPSRPGYARSFSDTPLGNDIFAQFGNTYAMPVVGNFDPPSAAAATPTFTVVGPTTGTYQAGQTVNISWAASNVTAGSTVSLCYDSDTTFNGNEHWIEIDKVSATNSGGTYAWNTTGVAPGTYYLAGYMYDGSKATFSHLGQAITITAPASQTFVLSGPTSGSFQKGASVTIQWTAGNVVAGSKISLCYDTDTTFNGNEHWIEIDGVTAANGSGSYTWNTANVPAGTYYLAGYLYNGSKATFSHLGQAITITAPPAQTFALSGPTSGTYMQGNSVSIQWAAGNVAAGSTISLCYDTDTTFNGNEHWIEIDAVKAANGSGSYTWNTTNVPTGTYYVAGYLYNGSKATFSHLGQSITIAAALNLASPSSQAPASLPASAVLTSQAELTPIVNEAIRRLAGVTGSAALAHVSVEIADLPGTLLGETIGNTIIIDRNAAGYGWFVDPTPADDSEFADVLSPYDLAAAGGSSAVGRADLLTTVMHELGHVLGYGDTTTDGLMDGTLPLGVRRTSAVDQVFATLHQV